MGGDFFDVVEVVVSGEGEVGAATTAVEDLEGSFGGRKVGEDVVEEFEEFVDLGVLRAHGGADLAFGGHDAEELEEVVGGAFGEGRSFHAVVGLGNGEPRDCSPWA